MSYYSHLRLRRPGASISFRSGETRPPRGHKGHKAGVKVANKNLTAADMQQLTIPMEFRCNVPGTKCSHPATVGVMRHIRTPRPKATVNLLHWYAVGLGPADGDRRVSF